MNLRSRLEEQLASVVEKDDLANASRLTPHASSEMSPEAPCLPAGRCRVSRDTTDVTIISPHRDYDKRLVAHVAQSASSSRRRLTVRVSEHDASPHVVALGGLARKVVHTPFEPELLALEDWTAPYEAPPSIDTIASFASDLYVDRVEPALWLEQFTAGNAEISFKESYGLWSRIRAPFIRWEHAEGSPTPTPVVPAPESALARLRRRVTESFAKAKDREEAMIAEIEQEWGAPVLIPRVAPARVMVGFITLLLVVSLPAGAVSLSRSVGSSWVEVSAFGRAAVSSAERAVTGSPSDPAAWGRVSKNLNETDQALNRVNALAVAITQTLPETRNAYASARNLLRAGDASAKAAELLTQGLDRAITEPTRYPVDRGRIFKTYLDSAVPLLDDANEALADVDTESLPESERAKAEEAIALLASVREGVRELRIIIDLLMAASGDEHRRTYLFVFQNSTELRPTGGFMGSLAMLTLDRGEIKTLEVPGGGPYDLQGELKERVRPPEPLRLIASRWEFQDANWFPDFPAAAKKISWFWSKGGKPTVDGVIAVNLRVLERLLEVTGPVELPEYGKTITAGNVWMEMQKAVELEYDRAENKPKKIVGDLMAKLLERLKASNQEQWLKLLTLGTDSLETKDIQVWLANEDEEALVERFGWSGWFKETPGDSLAVIGTNIAGQKSDRLIRERVEHAATIQQDGSIVDTVTITRTHTGQKGDLFTGVNNVTYLRVYVPKGSELISADGFSPPASDLFKPVEDADPEDMDLQSRESNRRDGVNGVKITDEFGRTAFGGWVQLEPGESKTTVFTYRLPFTAMDIASRLRPDGAPAADAIRPAYTALYTSQSGKPERTLISRTSVPADWTLAWSHGEAPNEETAWDRDRVSAGLFVYER